MVGGDKDMFRFAPADALFQKFGAAEMLIVKAIPVKRLTAVTYPFEITDGILGAPSCLIAFDKENTATLERCGIEGKLVKL